MTVYKSPGVYVKEVDISTYYPPKKYKRMRKIAKIFDKTYTPPFLRKI